MKEYILENLQVGGIFIGVIVATILLAAILNRIFGRLIRKSTEDMQNDPTTYQFLKHTVVALVYIVGFSLAIYTLPSLRAVASSILAGAGILAVAIGFASQQALSNIISGIFIIIFKPFRVHDRLKIGELRGVVEDITLRHTVIRNYENQRILIPNSIISDEVIINSDFGDERICKHYEIGISYSSNIELAKEIIHQEAVAHPLHIDPRTPEQIEAGELLAPVRVVSFGDSAVNLRLWVWAKDTPDAFLLTCDLNERIKTRFDQADIEIPFPHRTIYNK